MRFLLHLKHWQLFLLTWGTVFLMNLVVLIDIKLMLFAFPIAMLLFTLGTFGWIWAIATQLHSLAPSSAGLNLGRFKLLFSVPLLYAVLLVFGVAYIFYRGNIGEAGLPKTAIISAMVLMHLLSMAGVFYGLRFAAKTYKSVELQREAHLSDYLVEFFLLWFSIVGVWLLQPRLNALAAQTEPQQ
ncbi:hypothetical protein [Hymenobacter koreensis]